MLRVLPNLHFKGRKCSRAVMKVSTGTAAPQDTKVMGKASHGPSEKISALDDTHTMEEDTLQPETHFGKTGKLLAVLLSVTPFSLPFPEAEIPPVLLLLSYWHF